MLLSIAYAPPIQFFSKLLTGAVYIEAHEHFIKQTYRNRCHILSPDGVIPLVIPVEQGASHQCPIREVRLSDHDHWRSRHWQALKSYYSTSPFYEYYAPDLEPLYRESFCFLFDFNWALLNRLIELMHLKVDLRLTTEYQEKDAQDFRTIIRPKQSPVDLTFKSEISYYQLFGQQEKNSFYPNLSIYDLLFNMGPESVDVLRRTLVS